MAMHRNNITALISRDIIIIIINSSIDLLFISHITRTPTNLEVVMVVTIIMVTMAITVIIKDNAGSLPLVLHKTRVTTNDKGIIMETVGRHRLHHTTSHHHHNMALEKGFILTSTISNNSNNHDGVMISRTLTTIIGAVIPIHVMASSSKTIIANNSNISNKIRAAAV